LPSPFAPFAGLTAFLAPLEGVFGGIFLNLVILGLSKYTFFAITSESQLKIMMF
jgi:hypothetical protein